MVLSLRIGTGDPVPAILGICCWEEAASASAWRNVTEMCRTFPRNFAPPPDDKPPGLPWLATMPMPMAANIELGEFATGLSSAVDLAWAVIAP